MLGEPALVSQQSNELLEADFGRSACEGPNTLCSTDQPISTFSIFVLSIDTALQTISTNASQCIGNAQRASLCKNRIRTADNRGELS